MSAETTSVFISYCRADSVFVRRLVADLRTAGTNVWLDQQGIVGGERWDLSVERAILSCTHMIVALSPASVASQNVLDEVSFALKKNKTVIPVLHQDCEIPFRLDRLQYLDFRTDYASALDILRPILVQNGRYAPPVSAAISPSSHPPQSPDHWKALSGAGLLLALALTWVFGIISSAIYHALGGGFFGAVIGAVLALATAYGAVALSASIIPAASLAVIKVGVIAMLAINFFMYSSAMGIVSMVSVVCGIIGAAIATRRSASLAAK